MPQPPELERLFSFFNEINIIAQLSNNLFEQQLPEGLTPSQFSVLNWFMRVDDEATPGRLAKAFQVTGGAMTNTLSKLEGKGFVSVRPDENSGRRKIVTITKKGRVIRDASIAAMGPMLAQFAEEFDVRRIERQMKTLSEVRAYLDEYRYRSSSH